MNLPNKLTVMRVILIPFFVAALLYDNGSSQTMRVVAKCDLYCCQPYRSFCTERSPASTILLQILENLWIL